MMYKDEIKNTVLTRYYNAFHFGFIFSWASSRIGLLRAEFGPKQIRDKKLHKFSLAPPFMISFLFLTYISFFCPILTNKTFYELVNIIPIAIERETALYAGDFANISIQQTNHNSY